MNIKSRDCYPACLWHRSNAPEKVICMIISAKKIVSPNFVKQDGIELEGIKQNP